MSYNEPGDFDVAIIGAGIAGLALAIGLHKQGIPFKLYEEAPQYSVVGAGIGFGPNGLLAMDLIEEGFRPKYEAICVGNKSEKDQSVFFEGLLCKQGLGLNEKWHGNSSWGSPDYNRKSAHRRELLDILTSFIPIKNVKFSKRLDKIEQSDDSVRLHFADGEVVESSMVVGSDGIQSVVREHVLSLSHPRQVQPRFAQSYAYRAVIPMDEAKQILGDLTDTAKMYLGQDRMVVTYRITGGAEFNFLHCVYDDHMQWSSSEAVTEEVSHEQMMKDFEGRDIDPRLLQLLEKAKPIRWGMFHHLNTPTYYRGRVVLLGDSAHASLPYQAAGAGQGVEDALILSTTLGHIPVVAKTLSGRDGLQAALKAYDEVRRPRAQRQTEQSLEAGELLSFRDPDAGSNMDKILPRLQKGRFDWLWFHDLRKDVDLAREKMDGQPS